MLTAFRTGGECMEIRPASPRRDWMTGDRFPAPGHAYRCVPLTAANAAGWELLCPTTLVASWGGGEHPASVGVAFPGRRTGLVSSHFGNGILTFMTGYLFRTEPDHDLWVKGPANRPRDGLQALEGLVETDWLPFPFTLNYRFTRPGQPVVFEEGEPLGQILVVPRRPLPELVLRDLSEEPSLQAEFTTWAETRRLQGQMGDYARGARRGRRE